MEQNEKYFNDLVEVRKLMENSSRFISLSGWSGILAGVFALIGMYLVQDYFIDGIQYSNERVMEGPGQLIGVLTSHSKVFITALAVVTLSVICGIALTVNRAKHKGQTILDKIALRMIVNLSIPVVAGGAFILLMIDRGYFELIIPAMLIFYGLGLINGSKYTLYTIRNLGIIQIGLGILAGLFAQYDFVFWGLGFGVMHIVYGAFMWYKYERKAV